MMTKMPNILSILCLVGFISPKLVIATTITETTTISNFSAWSGTNYVASLGEPAQASMGQTFRLNKGDATGLDSITFHVWNDNLLPSEPGEVDFALYLYQWDGNKIYGDSLFQSDQMTTTYSPTNYETFSVNTGGLNLSIGQDYAWFLSTSMFFDGTAGTALVAQQPGSYDYGNFIYMNNENDFGLLSTNAWSQYGSTDLIFTLELSSTKSVPEPTSLTLLGLGLAGLGFARQKKRGRI